jgi:hypothetical protein
VKQSPLRPKTEHFTDRAVDHDEQRIRHCSKSFRHDADLKPGPQHDDLILDQIQLEQSELKRVKELPKEVGLMLITAGIVGLILPGPGTPALIAGGLALWPKAFDRLESWLEQHHPVAHRESMKQIDRFLNDLERRYPFKS